MKSGLFLNVVVTQGTTILELLSGKDQTLLVWGNSFLILDLGLDVIDGVGRFDLKSDGLASDCKEMTHVSDAQDAKAVRWRWPLSERGECLRVFTKICIVADSM